MVIYIYGLYLTTMYIHLVSNGMNLHKDEKKKKRISIMKQQNRTELDLTNGCKKDPNCDNSRNNDLITIEIDVAFDYCNDVDEYAKKFNKHRESFQILQNDKGEEEKDNSIFNTETLNMISIILAKKKSCTIRGRNRFKHSLAW